MKKRILQIALFFLAVSMPCFATTYTATGCTAANVQSAITSAVDGDTVQCPVGGGSVTWNSVISGSKGIILQGNGWSVTFGTSGQLALTADTTANTFVTGFTFNNGFINGGCPIKFFTTLSPLTKPFRFYGNTFSDNGLQGAGVTEFCTDGTGPGLVDHNTFNTLHGADEIIHVLGAGVSDYSQLSTDVTPSGPNMLFIEDNTFFYDSFNSPANAGGPPYYYWGTSAVQVYYGGRLVFRNNLLKNVQVDAHGHSPGACSGNGSENGARWFEVYNNTWDVTHANSNQGSYMEIRGGTGIAFGNRILHASNNETSGGFKLTNDCTSGGTWPLQAQIGRGINDAPGNPGTSGNYNIAYFWDNDATNNPTYSGNSTFVAIGNDETDATNCSVHAGNVCDVKKTTSQPSTFHRCESAADEAAGCQVSYVYAPYPYPHPLQGAAKSLGSGVMQSSVF